MSWTVDVVYEAIKAIGAMHRAGSIPSSGIMQDEIHRARVLAFRAYGTAVHLLAQELREGGQAREKMLMVVLLLLHIFEVSSSTKQFVAMLFGLQA